MDERDQDDDEGTEQGFDVGRRLKLREIKTLERQILRKENTTTKDLSNNESVEEEQSEVIDNDLDNLNLDDEVDSSNDELSDEDDPFLAAIGGKILTGKAYQEQMLSSN